MKMYKLWITFENDFEEYTDCTDIVFNNSGFLNFKMYFDDGTFSTIGITTKNILMYEVKENK